MTIIDLGAFERHLMAPLPLHLHLTTQMPLKIQQEPSAKFRCREEYSKQHGWQMMVDIGIQGPFRMFF